MEAMIKLYLKLLLFFCLFALTLSCKAELFVLFDENAKDEAGEGKFAELFVSHDAGSTVTITDKETYLGKVSVYVTPAQSYNSNMVNWRFSIVEKPSAQDEYRYIHLAWKSDGGTGVMIQFPDNGAWGAVTVPCLDPPAPGSRRYIAGANVTGWSGICVADDIPTNWTVIERDLFSDFGSFVMTGMALTPFSDGGKGDYYDAIMLAKSEKEFAKFKAVLPKDKLSALWSEIKTNSY